MGSTIWHIYWQANKSADHLARMGAKQLEEFVEREEPPPSVRHFVLEDALGLDHLRNDS